MMRLGLWIIAIAAVLVALDRALLWAERNGWINYRWRGMSRPGTAYHALILESIFNPAAENLIEAKYTQEQEQDESGDTNRPQRGDHSPPAPEAQRAEPQ